MPVINQWHFTDTTGLYATYDVNPVIYDHGISPPSAVLDGVPFLVTPKNFGTQRACYIEASEPFFIRGSSGGFIQIGFYFNVGTNGSFFDMRSMIQGPTGGFYQLRVFQNTDFTIDLELGATPPGAYGLSKSASLFRNSLGNVLGAATGLTLYQPVFIRFQWDVTPPADDRPIVSLYGGIGDSPTTVGIVLSATANFTTFPAFVPGGHTPPFSPTLAEIYSINPLGLYILKPSILEHTIFLGPESSLVFNYVVVVLGSLIDAEHWDIPLEYTTANVILAETWEPVPFTGTGNFDIRSLTTYRRW